MKDGVGRGSIQRLYSERWSRKRFHSETARGKKKQEEVPLRGAEIVKEDRG